jgi:hypothetical protein
MQHKTTNKLFWGKYQYKLVVVCPGSSWFRGGNWLDALEQLKKIDFSNDKHLRSCRVKTQEDLDYAFKLLPVLSKLTDIEVRVETPWVTIYTNTKSNIDKLSKLDTEKVKYICEPPANITLDAKTIILPKVNYDFKITMGKTMGEHTTFVVWAENNSKIKLTKTCKRELSRNFSWGGTYFYVTGENNLLMAKMHLGGSINKVERIIKAQS